VPTFTNKLPKQMDTKDLDSSKLAELKKKDPFMYYSIPAVRGALFRGRSVDPSNVIVTSTTSSSSEGMQASAPSQIVKRRTRVAFECHSDLLLEDVLGDASNAETDDSNDDSFDEFLSVLERSMKRIKRA